MSTVGDALNYFNTVMSDAFGINKNTLFINNPADVYNYVYLFPKGNLIGTYDISDTKRYLLVLEKDITKIKVFTSFDVISEIWMIGVYVPTGFKFSYENRYLAGVVYYHTLQSLLVTYNLNPKQFEVSCIFLTCAFSIKNINDCTIEELLNNLPISDDNRNLVKDLTIDSNAVLVETSSDILFNIGQGVSKKI